MKKRIISLIMVIAMLAAACPNALALKTSKGNIALGKPTTCSSIYENLEMYAPSFAVDGDSVSEWMSYVSGSGQWIVVDLEGEYLVSKVRVMARYRMDDPGYNNFELQLSNTPDFSSYEVIHKQSGDRIPFQNWLEVDVTTPTKYRYFRYIATMADCRGVSEIEIFDSSAEPEDAYEKFAHEDWVKAVKLLEYTGITSLSEFKEEAVITRGRAIQLINRLGGISANVSESSFADVYADSPYLGDIEAAYQSGWISMPEDKKFRPNDYIKKNEFLKILACSIGYGEILKAYGAWPLNIERLSAELRLTKGADIHDSGVITQENMVIMMYNALKAPFLEQTFSGDSYSFVKSDSVLERKYQLEEYRGIVTADKYSDLAEGGGTGNRTVKVGANTYVDENSQISGMLGYSIDFFVEVGSEKIVIAALSSSNMETEFSGGDITSTQSEFLAGKIEFETVDGKKGRISLEDGFTVVSSGIANNNARLDDLKGEDTLLIAVDSDGDGTAEVLYADAYNSSVVKTAFTDGDGNTLITCEDGSRYNILAGSNCKFTLISEAGLLPVGSIEKGDVLTIAQSSDGRSTRAYVSQLGSFTGIAENISDSDNEVTIGGKSYPISAGYYEAKNLGADSAVTINVGNTYEFETDIFGKIVAVYSDAGNGLEYAFLIRVATEGGISDKYQAKLLLESGEIKTFDLAEGLKLNGRKANSTDMKSAENMGVFSPDVCMIKYADGVITELDTVGPNVANGETADNSIDKKDYGQEMLWNYWNNIMYLPSIPYVQARYAVNNTPVFVVPVKTEGGIRTVQEGNEKFFRVYKDPGHANGYDNQASTRISVGYDVDPMTKVGKAFIIYEEIGSNTTSAMDPIVIERAALTINDEEEICVKIEGYGTKGAVEIITTADCQRVDIAGSAVTLTENLPQCGDIYLYHLDSQNKVDKLELVFDYDVHKTQVGTTTGVWFEKGAANWFTADVKVNFGYAVGVNDNLVSISDVLPTGDNMDAVSARMDVFDMGRFRMYSRESDKSIKIITQADMPGYEFAGNPNARIISINGINGDREMMVCYQIDEN